MRLYTLRKHIQRHLRAPEHQVLCSRFLCGPLPSIPRVMRRGQKTFPPWHGTRVHALSLMRHPSPGGRVTLLGKLSSSKGGHSPYPLCWKEPPNLVLHSALPMLRVVAKLPIVDIAVLKHQRPLSVALPFAPARCSPREQKFHRMARSRTNEEDCAGVRFYHSPTYFQPLRWCQVPSPCILFPFQPPSYRSPLAFVYLPAPCFRLSAKPPS
jgi:hypothetical protein